jgi:hypothetical protein
VGKDDGSRNQERGARRTTKGARSEMRRESVLIAYCVH